MKLTQPFLYLLSFVASQTALAADLPPSRVVVTTVQEQEIATTSAHTGVVDFDRISAVSGEVSGQVIHQYAVEGTLIKAGEPLIELNTDLILKDMDIKQKQRAQVSADIEKLNRTLKRLESLLATNSASRQAYEDALYDHRSLQKKRETLDEEMERLKLQLNKSTVRAPFDGVVLEKLKESGEWIDPGVPVCRIASTQDLLVRVAVSENLARYQQPGATVPVTIPAMNLQLEGKIRGLVPVANLRSKSVTLKIGIPYRTGMIQNMTASVDIATSQRQRLLMVPRDALVNFKGKDFVYSIQDGKAKLMPIDIVTRTGNLLGVTRSPLAAGMQVVVDGNDRLRPDQSVQIVSNNR
ncbi:efflux RND transporter periplasmic adaptor subunit [Sedimenticola sp.]|uniref:efflux RND transporter periplasmic adaptor subunit n=1 Tax=Sedimenticola sp. TaxID=1940285 RepID=UPI003D103796